MDFMEHKMYSFIFKFRENVRKKSACLSPFNERLNMSEILISFNLISVLLVWLSETLSRPSNFALQSVNVIIKQDNKIHEYPHRYMFA